MPVVCVTHDVCNAFDADHTALNSATHYKVFSDIIPIVGYNAPDVEAIESIGDILIFTGWVLYPFTILALVLYSLLAFLELLVKFLRY
jgi:hypothetical protein